MRALMAVLAVVAISSCATSSAPVASVSPAATPKTAAPAWNGPVCSLPVMLWSDIGQETQPGFIKTSTGAFTPDPKGAAALHGQSGSYNAALRVWVPVPREHVSPDGSQYSYTSIQPGALQGVHLVDVRSGADNVIPRTEGDQDARGFHYWVVAFQPEGIYVSLDSQIASRGLFLTNPVTGTTIRVSTETSDINVFVSGGQAWWTGDSEGPSPDPSVYHQPLTGVAGQHAASWFSGPGSFVRVLGVDPDGAAVVVAQSRETAQLWLLQTPNSAVKIGETPVTFNGLMFRSAVADSGGWWVGGKNGVYFTAGSTMQTVSSTPAIVVGACQAS